MKKFFDSEFWKNLKKQAEANPMLALSIGLVVLGAVTKLGGMAIDYRNSRAWLKEVQRRAIKDSLRR